LTKKFNHIEKATSILNLKSGGSHKLSYFSTSTLSRHTFHLHNQLIASDQFLIWKKYYRPTTSDQFLTWIGFDI
jgi:hypothetical protein